MMVGGEAFSIDASLIKADINKTKRIPGDQPFSWRSRAYRLLQGQQERLLPLLPKAEVHDRNRTQNYPRP